MHKECLLLEKTLWQDYYADLGSKFWVLISRTDKMAIKPYRTIDAKGNIKQETQDATVNGSDVQVIVTHDYYSATGKAGLR